MTLNFPQCLDGQTHLQNSPSPGCVSAAWGTQSGSAPDWLPWRRAARAWRSHWWRRRVGQLRPRRWRRRGSGRTCRWRSAGRDSDRSAGRCLHSYRAEDRGLQGATTDPGSAGSLCLHTKYTKHCTQVQFCGTCILLHFSPFFTWLNLSTAWVVSQTCCLRLNWFKCLKQKRIRAKSSHFSFRSLTLIAKFRLSLKNWEKKNWSI